MYTDFQDRKTNYLDIKTNSLYTYTEIRRQKNDVDSGRNCVHNQTNTRDKAAHL